MSPDGKKIAFTRAVAASPGVPANNEIFTMDVSGANQTNVTNNFVYDSIVTWSPDNTTLTEPDPDGGRV